MFNSCCVGRKSGPWSKVRSENSFIREDLRHLNPRREGEEGQPRTCQPAATAPLAEVTFWQHTRTLASRELLCNKSQGPSSELAPRRQDGQEAGGLNSSSVYLRSLCSSHLTLVFKIHLYFFLFSFCFPPSP